MDDCRVTLMRTRAAAHRIEAARLAVEAARQTAEAARLEAEADATLALRVASDSRGWAELPPLCMETVMQYLKWDPAACGVMRAVCSAWSSLHDMLRPGQLRTRSLAVMVGKLSWFPCVTAVDLTGCANGVCGPLAELRSLPSLRSLSLPMICAESAVDAEVVYGLTTLTTLRLYEDDFYEDGERVELGEWVLDLSRLTTLTSLYMEVYTDMDPVTDKQVLALSHLTGLKELNLAGCWKPTAEGLCAVRSLTALTTLSLADCPNVSDEVLRALSSLTSLTDLCLKSQLTGVWTFEYTEEAEEALEALRTAIPNLTIREYL
jgi:hypothetical protein